VLQITVPLSEEYDERTSEFAVAEAVTLTLEHSLVSLSKWESKHEVPFLGPKPMSHEDMLDYVRMMILGDPPPDSVISRLGTLEINEINEYVNAKMTATWFNERDAPRPRREIITAELIYYWMISLNIPFECQYWHLNRLLTLIRVCNLKNTPKKKMPSADAAAQQRELNALRRQQLGTTG
jgi:hypothetical protein